MLSQSIRLQVKFQKQEEVLQEPPNMMLWVHKLDLLTVHKAKLKKEKRLSIQ